MSPRIGIDLLGSDISPASLLELILKIEKTFQNTASLTLFGTEDLAPPSGTIDFVVVKEWIGMEEDPLTALRHKKEASICVGIKMLRDKKLDAFISAGNTGALMGCAALVLPLLPGVEKPALLTLLPTKQKELAVIDVGANISCNADHLFQFARMGATYQQNRGIARPRVGLLNIGTEEKKGTAELREAYKKLQHLENGEFIGNIEARDVFQGNLDVLVTDGFTGNVFLKTAEGIAGVILEQLEEYAGEEWLKVMRERLTYAEYPGALLCGVDGIVIKCHGNAFFAGALTRSIDQAVSLIKNR